MKVTAQALAVVIGVWSPKFVLGVGIMFYSARSLYRVSRILLAQNKEVR